MQILQTEWFWAMVQAVGVIITLVLIYTQIHIQTSSHVVQTLGAIHARWIEDPMLRARFRVCSNYLNSVNEFDGVSEYIAEYMEELGGYVKIKAVPPQIMWDAQSWYIEHYYCMFRPGIEKIRQTYHDETLYKNIETLFKIMGDRSKREGAPGSHRGGEDLRRFAENEIQVTKSFLHLREPQ